MYRLSLALCLVYRLHYYGQLKHWYVNVQSKIGRATVLNEPIQHQYLLEVCCQGYSATSQPEELTMNVKNNETPSVCRMYQLSCALYLMYRLSCAVCLMCQLSCAL